jgi:hypothetical protein
MGYGPVPRGAIKGKIVWLILPLSRFGSIAQRPTLQPAHI